MSVLNTTPVVSGFGVNQNKPTSENILGKDDFLRLLVAQLHYQDPLQPMEATDFSAQLAQFSSVEQLFKIDETLQASLDGNYLLAASINNTLAATVIGKEVRAHGNQLYYDGAGETALHFRLPENAKDVTVEILDASGQVKRTLELSDLQSGDRQITWDGKDDQGRRLKEGIYEFRVTAKNPDGAAINAQTFMSGQITGVRYGENGAVLMLGELEIALADVYEILQSNNYPERR